MYKTLRRTHQYLLPKKLSLKILMFIMDMNTTRMTVLQKLLI